MVVRMPVGLQADGSAFVKTDSYTAFSVRDEFSVFFGSFGKDDAFEDHGLSSAAVHRKVDPPDGTAAYPSMGAGNPGIVVSDGVLVVVPAVFVGRLFPCFAYEHPVGDNHVVAQVASGFDEPENDADLAYLAKERVAFSRPVVEHGTECFHPLHFFSGQGHPSDVRTPRPVVRLSAAFHALAFNPDPGDLFSVLGREDEDVLLGLDGADDVPGCQYAMLAIGSSQKCSRTDRAQLPLCPVTDDGRVSAYEIGEDP